MRHNLILSTLLLATFLQGCHTQACGRAPLNPRIVGGSPASPGGWPWQVYLEIPLTGQYISMCGGALINKQWILTAAHCLYGQSGVLKTDVYLGLINLLDPNLVQRKVIQAVIHKDYNPATVANDIALMKMNSPVTFNNYIQPVCLAQTGSTFFTGVNTWVAGFGAKSEGGDVSAVLREVSVPIVGDNECKCKNPLLPIPPKTICAGYKTGGKDTCQGDSGGPLVVKQGTTWIQTGIVSFGVGCARPDTPGVYTDVSEFQDWIKSIVGTTDPPGFVKHTSTGTDSDKTYICDSSAATAASITTVISLLLVTFSLL